jgi:hypothetical protein
METTYMHSNKAVEVFKTTVNKEWHARHVVVILQNLLPGARINFDMEDCDHILRIEMQDTLINTQQIIEAVNATGYYAELLK